MTEPTRPREPAFSFEGVALRTEPYRHAIVSGCMSEAAAEGILRWFETDAPWSLTEADFYEQWEFDMVAAADGRSEPVTGEAAQAGLRAAMSRLFGVRVDGRVSVVAHRLLPGQRIGIHNDHLPDGETHRLTVQLNRGLGDDDGGFLMTFASDDARDVGEVVRPVHRSAFAFEISPRSFHAVSKVHGGARYSMVISFHAVPG